MWLLRDVVNFKIRSINIGRSKGALGTNGPSRSNVFHFQAVFGKILPNNRFLSTSQGMTLFPPSGKSWIRHLLKQTWNSNPFQENHHKIPSCYHRKFYPQYHHKLWKILLTHLKEAEENPEEPCHHGFFGFFTQCCVSSCFQSKV